MMCIQGHQCQISMILIWVNFLIENHNENIHEGVKDNSYDAMTDKNWTEHFKGLHINSHITVNPNKLPVGINPDIIETMTSPCELFFFVF